MKNLLKQFVAWLDRKFPDKVVVTEAEYRALKTKLDAIEAILGRYSEARIKKIEDEINKFNVSLGFGALMAKTGLTPFER
jgi:hypothetical protein